MIVRKTTNQDDIKKILFHPDIYPNISDGVELDFNNAKLPMDDVMYVGGYDPNIFAVSCFHSFQDGLKFHPNVLPEFRLKYGRDFVKQTAFMVKCPLYVEIPKTRKRLFNLAKKIGFDSIVNNKDPSKHLMRLL